jgi:hypothetical protein
LGIYGIVSPDRTWVKGRKTYGCRTAIDTRPQQKWEDKQVSLMDVFFALDSIDLYLLRESTIEGEEESPNRLAKCQEMVWVREEVFLFP